MRPDSPYRFTIGPLAFLIGVTTLFVGCRSASPPSAPSRIVPSSIAPTIEVIGHRGAAGLAPENTLAAFRRACALGVAGIELDVHLTADSVLVVHHDYALHPDLTRDAAGQWISGVQRPQLNQMTLAEIRRYDVGRLRPGSDYAKRHPEQQSADGERVPTFDEVLRLFVAECAPPTRLVVEIKSDPTQPTFSAPPALVAERVVAALRTRQLVARAQIIAFDWRALRRVAEIAPEFSTSHLTFEGKDWNTIEVGAPGPAAWMGGMDVDDHGGSVPRAIKAAGGRNWSPNTANITPALVAEAHGLGLKVYVWTVNAELDMERFISMGVDGITTDRPDLANRVRARLARP